MKMMEYIRGCVFVVYQDNSLGLNQDHGYSEVEDPTQASCFIKLRANAKHSRKEILDLLIQYNFFKRKDGEYVQKLKAALKDIEDPVFSFIYEKRFYNCRKLPTRTNVMPLRVEKMRQVSSTVGKFEHGYTDTPLHRVQYICEKALADFPDTILRVRIIGKPFKWAKGQPWDAPINHDEVIDERI